MKELFPAYLFEAINKLPLDKLNEMRLRLGKKIIVNIQSKMYYLSNIGLTSNEESAITVTKDILYDIIKRASEHSIYAINNQLKQGYITVVGGIRLGIAGEIVYEGKNIKTIKNFCAINIRIPHEVKNCSIEALPFILENEFLNTLIISPPGCGKTTFIRDVLYQLSRQNYCYNILLVDERCEIANCFNGEPQLDIGKFTDVYSCCSKLYGFENGIRSMRPDIIVTDELATQKDIEALEYAANCGVKVLSSVHAYDVEDLKTKPYFDNLIKNKIFKRYIVLSSKNGPGTYQGIYDENMRLMVY